MATNKMSVKPTSKAHATQLKRIQEDEKINTQEEAIKSDLKANLNASWTETLEQMCQQKRMKRLDKEIKQEMLLANKSLAIVRKTRLQKLLEAEHKEHEKELNAMGLTFHKERI